MLTDPIADMLTRIRNAVIVKNERVDVPASKLKVEIAKIMKDEGFIKAYKIVKDKKQGIIKITLKYNSDNTPVISGLKRISKPGRRVYVGKEEIPKVMGGLGISIVSTSKGVLSDRACVKEGVGGELLCQIW